MLIALALAAAPVPETPPNPCPMFERLLAAAREAPAFASVRQALAGGDAIVPGFNAADCSVDAVAALNVICGAWARTVFRTGASPRPVRV